MNWVSTASDLFILFAAFYLAVRQIQVIDHTRLIVPLFATTFGLTLIIFRNPGIAAIWAGINYTTASILAPRFARKPTNHRIVTGEE